jgi:hypothetical protein
VLEIVIEQQRNVRLPLAERRDLHVNDIQPVVQVLSEIASSNPTKEVAIGRRQDPHVHALLDPIGAETMNLAGFEEAQEHGLHARRHLAEFVEEERALVGDRRESGLVSVRAGEAAADVSKQFRLQQRIGQACAVDCHERMTPPAPRCGRDARRSLCRRRSHRRSELLRLNARRCRYRNANARWLRCSRSKGVRRRRSERRDSWAGS